MQPTAGSLNQLGIAQVPVLFTGSMRGNLDPFGEYSDAECWLALKRANLAGLVEGAPAGLDMQLSAGGAPLSAGQKQLVALARALLKRSKVCALCLAAPDKPWLAGCGICTWVGLCIAAQEWRCAWSGVTAQVQRL